MSTQQSYPAVYNAEMFLQPCRLLGRVVRLEPLQEQHLDQLASAALHTELWRWTTVALATKDDVRRYIADALQDQARGTSLPFATFDLESDCIIGSTRFLNADSTHRRVEIGNTFVTPSHQRTRINTEAKYLMLKHAFEELNCIRVEFKTDALNQTSRAAIKRLGATEEGTLRSHMIVAGGRIRDSVYFSITGSEWQSVRIHLQDKLNQ